MNFSDNITAVITTSPVPKHPSLEFIEQVYADIRYHLENVPILILADGVRDEQRSWAEKYTEYKNALRNKEWPNVQIVEFSDFSHQAGMIRSALPKIQTPLILWVEHDYRLLPDFIDWNGIVETLLDNEVTSVRFATDDCLVAREPFEREAFISSHGVPLRKTVEYLSFPNIARRELYESFLPLFKTARTHLECTLTRRLTEQDNWGKIKLSIWNPTNRIRTLHLNARVFSDGFVGPKPPLED